MHRAGRSGRAARAIRSPTIFWAQLPRDLDIFALQHNDEYSVIVANLYKVINFLLTY